MLVQQPGDYKSLPFFHEPIETDLCTISRPLDNAEFLGHSQLFLFVSKFLNYNNLKGPVALILKL